MLFHCRATYDFERKLRIDHYESLQVMERNYISMVREVEKLRAELTLATNLDRSGANALGMHEPIIACLPFCMQSLFNS